MEIHIDKELTPELENIVATLKFRNKEEFINKAIRDKILEIKRKRFFEISDKISESLEGRGITEEEIINKFKKKRKE
jgi:predicted transcriptional regulator